LIQKIEGELALARQRLAGDLTDVLNLRPMPALALRITEACQDQQANLRSIIELIQCEPNISAKILSVVNSPIYGYSREINSLDQAVVVLGFKKLSELAVSIASKQVFEQETSADQPGPDTQAARMELYEHCLAAATLSRVLAQQPACSVDAGAAFLACMLHDVGKLFFFDLAPKTYSQIYPPGEETSSVEQELEVFGKTHAKLGMHFAIVSGLPSGIHDAIEHHHDNDSQQRSELAAMTDLANSLSKAWGIGVANSRAPNDVAQQWLTSVEEETVDSIRETANEQFQVLHSLFMI
jgi:putative nucleotidyltransferase with HDIG domain